MVIWNSERLGPPTVGKVGSRPQAHRRRSPSLMDAAQTACMAAKARSRARHRVAMTSEGRHLSLRTCEGTARFDTRIAAWKSGAAVREG